MLTEAIVAASIQLNVLAEYDIDNEIVVVDGGHLGNPSIWPPDGVKWFPMSVVEGKLIYVQDELDPNRGLTFTHDVDGVRPFIRLPRQDSLNILKRNGMKKIVCALEQCSILRKNITS